MPAGALLVEAGIEEGAEAVAAAGVTQFAEGLGFDLTNTLAGDGEMLPDFFEGMLAAVLKS